MSDERPLLRVVGAALTGQVPDDLVVRQGAEVRFGPDLARTPDLLVARTDEPDRPWFSPDEVLLAVEIEPTVEDRTTTPAIYGVHGIPHVWRVGPEPPTIRVFALRDGVHQQVAAAAHVLAHAPFPVEVDLGAACD